MVQTTKNVVPYIRIADFESYTFKTCFGSFCKSRPVASKFSITLVGQEEQAS